MIDIFLKQVRMIARTNILKSMNLKNLDRVGENLNGIVRLMENNEVDEQFSSQERVIINHLI